MKLLGDHCFAHVGTKARCWTAEENGIVNFFQPRFSGVTKANINRDPHRRAANVGVGAESQAAILQLFAHTVHNETLAIEYDAIVALDCANLGEDSKNAIGVGVAVSHQVQIARGPERHVEPRRHKHSAFENEAVAKAASAETIEEALDRVARQNEIERLLAFPGEGKKTCAHRAPMLMIVLAIGREGLEIRLHDFPDAGILGVGGDLGRTRHAAAQCCT